MQRRKTNRIKCTVCYQKGHNRRTCKRRCPKRFKKYSRNPQKKWICQGCNNKTMGEEDKLPYRWTYFDDPISQEIVIICSRCALKYAVSPTMILGEPSTPTAAIPESANFHEEKTRISEAPSSLDSPKSPKFAHFRILKELGRGGQGVVYKVFDEKLKRIVALKTLLAQGDINPELLRRFKRESQAIARLNHPGIAAIYEAGEFEKQHYLTMSYIEGNPLDEILKLKGKNQLPLKKLLEILRNVCIAVNYAHSQKIVHRDIKPQNIMLNTNLHPYVLDFGLAKISDETKLTKTGTIAGSLSYMSPQQCEGEEVDFKTDIWSLGIILYQILTGILPFSGGTRQKIVKEIITKEPIAPSLLNHRISKDLDTICLKALEKSPEKRYSSAAALAFDLERFLEGESIKARPIRKWQKWLRWIQRNKLAAGTAFLISSSSLGAGIAYTVVSMKEERTQKELEKAQEMREQDIALNKLVAEIKDRALTAEREGDLDSAIEEYAKIIKLNPNFVEAWCNRGAIKHLRGNDASALADLNQALKLDPKDTKTLYNRAAVYLEKEDFHRAFLDLDQAIKFGAKDFATRYSRGWARLKENDIEGASQDIDYAFELTKNLKTPSPNLMADLYEKRAWVNQAKGDKTAALEDINKSLEFDPKSVAWTFRAGLRENQGDIKGAIKDLERFLYFCPKAPQVPQIQEAIEKLKMKQ